MFMPILLVVIFSGLRILNTQTDLPNIMPLMALAFASSAFLKKRYYWLFPVAILVSSDIAINSYYNNPIVTTWSLVATASYVAAALWGSHLNKKKSRLKLIFGTLTTSFMFYIVSNTFAYISNSAYGPEASEWLRAITTGIPGFPPTYLFLRNSIIGDLSFTIFLILSNEAAHFYSSKPKSRNRMVKGEADCG